MRIIISLLLCMGITSAHAMNNEILYRELKDLGIRHPKIVLAQAKLETGNYTSQLCRNKKNLFGLKGKRGYMYFNSYKECILYYKDKIQSRYIGGDYYVFLKKIGYARDPAYIQKLKKITRSMKEIV